MFQGTLHSVQCVRVVLSRKWRNPCSESKVLYSRCLLSELQRTTTPGPVKLRQLRLIPLAKTPKLPRTSFLQRKRRNGCRVLPQGI
jgi:hypothetical protein